MTVPVNSGYISMEPFFRASYRKLVFPKLGFTVTLISVSSSIRSLYMLIKISGSDPNFPAAMRVFPDRPPMLTVDKTRRAKAVTKDRPMTFNERFSKNLMRALTTTANKAAVMAPMRMSAELFRSMPKRMKVPNPPAPIKAPRVAVPMSMTDDVRIPPIMDGMARTSSNFFSFSIRLMPKASAAS